MPIPKPQKDEKKNDYISRCIRFLEKEGGRKKEQIQAICFNIWQKNKK